MIILRLNIDYYATTDAWVVKKLTNATTGGTEIDALNPLRHGNMKIVLISQDI